MYGFIHYHFASNIMFDSIHIIEIECSDTNNGATDSYGDGCEYYVDNDDECGNYDDNDFTANTMCCACRGKYLQ